MKFFATLFVLCSAIVAQANNNVVIVLDTSGSMGDFMRSAGKSRIEVAQDALIEVLSQVPDTTKVGILSFEGWIYKLGPVDRAKLETAIRSTRPGGGTPLYEYVRAGATKLLTERANQLNVGSYKLLVVTDGEAGDEYLNEPTTFSDGTPKMGVLEDIMSRNIIIDAIGLDMEDDHSLKTMINGFYMRGDDPNSLVEAVGKAVAEVGFGDDQASEEAFAEIAEIPDGVAMAIINGLTTFSNHPIGEKPPVQVVKPDGTVTYEPDPTNEPVPELGKSDLGGLGIAMIVVGVIAGFIVVAMIIYIIISGGSHR